MILTKSPYYKTIPWKNPSNGHTSTSYVIEIYIWNGSKSEVPNTPNYEIENINPLGLTGSLDVNISPYINDVLNVATTKANATSVIDGECAVWVKTQVIYFFGTTRLSPEFVRTDFAVKGYTYGIEGKSSTLDGGNERIPENGVLAFGNFANISRQSQFTLPIKISETEETEITEYQNHLII